MFETERQTIPPEAARKVRLVVLDVDGVLTDGGLYLGATASGERVEMKRYEITDGLGIRLLQEAGIRDSAIEVIFWGADSGQVTVRDNPGIIAPGDTGTVEPDNTGGQDLTIVEQFARSMSLAEALRPDNLLAYEMNGQPLPVKNVRNPFKS